MFSGIAKGKDFIPNASLLDFRYHSVETLVVDQVDLTQQNHRINVTFFDGRQIPLQSAQVKIVFTGLDDEGNVYATNVNTVEEMVNMMSASRSYKNNVEMINTTKDLLLQTLSLGR